jgi:hypothetical protein
LEAAGFVALYKVAESKKPRNQLFINKHVQHQRISMHGRQVLQQQRTVLVTTLEWPSFLGLPDRDLQCHEYH